MKKSFKKVLSTFLAILMVLTIVPISSFASEPSLDDVVSKVRAEYKAFAAKAYEKFSENAIKEFIHATYMYGTVGMDMLDGYNDETDYKAKLGNVTDEFLGIYDIDDISVLSNEEAYLIYEMYEKNNLRTKEDLIDYVVEDLYVMFRMLCEYPEVLEKDDTFGLVYCKKLWYYAAKDDVDGFIDFVVDKEFNGEKTDYSVKSAEMMLSQVKSDISAHGVNSFDDLMRIGENEFDVHMLFGRFLSFSATNEVFMIIKGECIHDYEITVVEPTCEEDGYTLHTCKKCGDTFKTDIVSAKGHDYDENAVCKVCGKERNCFCLCHTKGIVKALFTLFAILDKYVNTNLLGILFKVGKDCRCGGTHY